MKTKATSEKKTYSMPILEKKNTALFTQEILKSITSNELDTYPCFHCSCGSHG